MNRWRFEIECDLPAETVPAAVAYVDEALLRFGIEIRSPVRAERAEEWRPPTDRPILRAVREDPR